jgi:hypothetical protein
LRETEADPPSFLPSLPPYLPPTLPPSVPPALSLSFVPRGMALRVPGSSQEPLPRRQLAAGLLGGFFDWHLMGGGISKSYSTPYDVAIVTNRPDLLLTDLFWFLPQLAYGSSRRFQFLLRIEFLPLQNSRLRISMCSGSKFCLMATPVRPLLGKWGIGSTIPVICGLASISGV